MSRRVLYGVLNWGLGHATRSSVIIRELQNQGFEPILASDGAAGEWLQEEFPHLTYRELPSYGIRYSRSNQQWPYLFSRLPQMAAAASRERKLAEMWAEDFDAVGIVSDNRLGFCSSTIPSAYLSHQLSPKAGLFTSIAGLAHRRYYQHFTELWIPDREGSPLSGGLSKGNKYARNIGMLSALSHRESDEPKSALMILSGPEPQRSILEQMLFDQAEALPENSVLVRGINGACPDRYLKRFKVFDRLGAEDLSRLMAAADIVISRSGYSSLMDYRTLGKKALLIPTPGQFEQEYLARLHHGNYGWNCAKQKNLNLKTELLKLGKLEAQTDWQCKVPDDLFNLFGG